MTSTRAFGSATKKRNNQCDVLTEWLTSLVSYLNDYIQFPEPQIPAVKPPALGREYSDEEIESAADAVRSAWGLGFGPIGNVTKLIESRGVFVAYQPIKSGSVNAFSFWSGQRPFIITGTDNTTAVRRRFDMAHELGHLVLHRNIEGKELEDKETLARVESEANRFAGAFLLPRSTYPNEVFTPRLSGFVPLKARWKVAIAAQVFRCSDLGILTETQVLSLRKQISAKRWRAKEPLDDELAIERPAVLERAARLALENGVLSTSTMEHQVGLSGSFIAMSLGLDPKIFQPADEDDVVLHLKRGDDQAHR